MDSFYICDDEWNKEKEVTCMDMGTDTDEDIWIMDDAQLDEIIETLRQNALYPLPDRDYSTKYVWFRRLTNSRLGRRILLRTLPKMKKER
jgi:hypothetical protein